MSYRYEDQKAWLFTDEGQRVFIQARDRALELLKLAGAFQCMAPFRRVTGGDVWNHFAIIDRMVELGDIREVTQPDEVFGQHRVFVSARNG